jgi:hypothetical protein
MEVDGWGASTVGGGTTSGGARAELIRVHNQHL